MGVDPPARFFTIRLYARLRLLTSLLQPSWTDTLQQGPRADMVTRILFFCLGYSAGRMMWTSYHTPLSLPASLAFIFLETDTELGLHRHCDEVLFSEPLAKFGCLDVVRPFNGCSARGITGLWLDLPPIPDSSVVSKGQVLKRRIKRNRYFLRPSSLSRKHHRHLNPLSSIHCLSECVLNHI